MGNSFKELMELKNCKNINVYFKKTKFRLSKKILAFYLTKEQELNKYIDLKNEEILNIPPEIIGKILIFKTDYSYDKETILNIIEFIPFRFFDIKKVDKNSYIVKYSFPFMKDVMMDIYRIIIFRHSYSTLKNILTNKGSALETIFEILLIFNLSPKGLMNTNIFNYFSISGKIQIRSIIKKKNEINDNNNLKYNLEKNKTYLIEQENLNGRDLDYLIIDMKDNESFLYGIQISIYKDEIFKKKI